MAFDLMGMVKDAVGREAMQGLSGLLGQDEKKTSSAFEAALPTLLGGILQKSSTPEGANEVYRAVEQQDDSILGKLPGLLSGGAGGLLENGASLLSSLFGSKLTALLPLLARLFGMDKGTVGKLLGFLGPVVMSVLSKHKAATGMDASGLASLLASQRESVDRAMPAEVKQELGFSRTAPAPVATAATPNPLAGWLLPLGLLALALLAFLLWPKGDKQAEEVDKTKIEAADRVADPSMEVDADTSTAVETLRELTTAVGSVTDEASARELVDRIATAKEKVAGMELDMLPAAARTTLGKTVAPLLEKLLAALETAYKIPGVEAIVKPAITPLLENFLVLSK